MRQRQLSFPTHRESSHMRFDPPSSFNLLGYVLHGYASIDNLGDIVIDIAPVGIWSVMKFDHLLAFGLRMRFRRSQRSCHNLNPGGAHQIESQAKQSVEIIGHNRAAVTAQKHRVSITESR